MKSRLKVVAKHHRPLIGRYESPRVPISGKLYCILRKRNLRVCGWSDGRIPWPRGRAGHGGKGAYIVTPELAEAIRRESEAAICYWWGVGIMTVCEWRRALGVERFNEGTRRLYSLWKEPKLPNRTVAFSPAALRRLRIERGLTQKEVASKMGWRSINSYGQMELGRRRRAILKTLQKLAAALGCRLAELRKK
jgi:DNA-binding XRE family transcriptional regulator